MLKILKILILANMIITLFTKWIYNNIESYDFTYYIKNNVLIHLKNINKVKIERYIIRLLWLLYFLLRVLNIIMNIIKFS